MSDDGLDMVELEAMISQINAYYEELNGESPRASAILATASLEDELEECIRSRFPADVDNTLWEDLAGPGHKPFSGFKAKSVVAFAFGFFGPETRKALDAIASIRNKFAHRKEIRDFSDSKIATHWAALGNYPLTQPTVSQPTPEQMKIVFVLTVRNIEEQLTRAREHIPELDPPLDPLP